MIVSCVRWVTNYNWGFCKVFSASNSCDFSIFKKNFVNICIQHISASMDSTESRKSFWKTTKSIDWVQERRIAISSGRLKIKLHFFNCIDCWFEKVIIGEMEGNSVT